jgi:hypothetical protein
LTGGTSGAILVAKLNKGADMKLLITTQYMENYGAHDWDGVGECPQYWKFKGGEDYFLPLDGFNAEHEFADKRLEMIVDSVRPKVEWSNEGSRQYIVGYEIVEDDYMTDFEKSQLEYDGRIAYPAKVIELEIA